MSKLRHILYLLVLATLASCDDKLDIIEDNDVIINVGDEVRFSALVPQTTTRSAAQEKYWEHINQFVRVQDDYVFDIDMWEKGEDADIKIASATYNPTKNTVNDVTTYDEYGTLTETNSYLYWPSSVKKYAFHAVSSNSTSSIADETTPGKSDQTTFEKYMSRDLIEGYGYVPGWDEALNEGEGAPIRNLYGYNYMTSKEWYAANKACGAPEEIKDNTLLIEYWKKIPLYMRHKRSRITVMLKAGEGVEREQIEYDPVLNVQNIDMEVYSYDQANNQTVVKPLLGSYTCQYRSPDPAPEEDILTACYDAIVTPHDYADGNNLTEQKILAINLSGMKFSFYAANDKAYSSAAEATNDDLKARYNLTEGKHLILEVTLSTDTRKILITAYVVDWEDWPFSSICDDFGQAADPLPINNKQELIEFLNNAEKNKAGNVGVIIPLNFNLIDNVYTKETAELENKKHLVKDSTGKEPGTDGYVVTYESGYVAVKEGDPIPGSNAGWNPGNYDLKATLKLAGATITTDQRLFERISASGSVINGTVIITDKGEDAELECAIAKQNYGTLERINVQKGETSRKATRAGLVTTNYGTVYACTSQMPVYNPGGESEILVGGIAAEMLYPTENGVVNTSTLPVIDQCNVNARIDGGSNVKGGGIAGKAEGKLTNNTYEYGITLSQDPERFKNILYAKGNQELSIYDNEWSTRVENAVANGSTLTNRRPVIDCYHQVIDSQEELKTLLGKGTYNSYTCRFRIADSFMVDDSWDLSDQNQPTGFHQGNLLCELNCNDKTITLTGTNYAQMLFSNIESHLYDLTIVLDKPIVAGPTETDGIVQLTARAPLAYSVVGDNAMLSNVKVKTGAKDNKEDEAYVQSAASGGLVVWAYDGAIIEDCESDADVRIALPENTGEQQTYFVGGLVNSAAKATILRCSYLRDNLNETEEKHSRVGSNIYYGGIVGGTSTKGVNTPILNISDCTSWLTWQTDEQLPHAAWGGIIGYSKYGNTMSDLVNAMDDNCQGNWWAATVGASSQGLASGMTEEKAIGKKNSVQPIRQ